MNFSFRQAERCFFFHSISASGSALKIAFSFRVYDNKHTCCAENIHHSEGERRPRARSLRVVNLRVALVWLLFFFRSGEIKRL